VSPLSASPAPRCANCATCCSRTSFRAHCILAVAAGLSGADERALESLGAQTAAFAPDAAGPKLFADWRAVGGLKQTLAGWAPTLTVASGGRMLVYGALAAKSAGAGRIVLIVDALARAPLHGGRWQPTKCPSGATVRPCAPPTP
ncbi:MAG: hypothetical protein WDN31_08460, partial [Hyphomicrobium sp.]